MNETDCQRKESHPTTPLSRCLILALQLAVIGSTCLGLCESLSAALASAKYFDDGRWPLRLIAAAFGKAAVTHTLLWTPLLIVAALVIFSIRRGRILSTPIPALFVVFVVLVAMVVVPADLHLATKLGQSVIFVISGVFALLGLLLAIPLRAFVRRCDERRLFRVLRWCTLLAILLTAGSGVAFVRSPFFNPGAYRVPTTTVRALHRNRPHILWIVMDTVRADRMSCYGYDKLTTPFLNTWVERSIVFNNAIGNGMWTVPSHASMFTGLSVRGHGLGRDRTRLDEKFKTVADVLSEDGYVTAS
ncbi:MAG: sulfatase-like hydrolase/transferase, partial [Planctomycetes bacterium]|nr:sulfatase-like hydrolase/transferase [Planctomycetota bacterium]